jgi:hypothetical protein
MKLPRGLYMLLIPDMTISIEEILQFEGEKQDFKNRKTV